MSNGVRSYVERAFCTPREVCNVATDENNWVHAIAAKSMMLASAWYGSFVCVSHWSGVIVCVCVTVPPSLSVINKHELLADGHWLDWSALAMK